jgi:hypothetical protein
MVNLREHLALMVIAFVIVIAVFGNAYAVADRYLRTKRDIVGFLGRHYK